MTMGRTSTGISDDRSESQSEYLYEKVGPLDGALIQNPDFMSDYDAGEPDFEADFDGANDLELELELDLEHEEEEVAKPQSKPRRRRKSLTLKIPPMVETNRDPTDTAILTEKALQTPSPDSPSKVGRQILVKSCLSTPLHRVSTDLVETTPLGHSEGLIARSCPSSPRLRLLEKTEN